MSVARKAGFWWRPREVWLSVALLLTLAGPFLLRSSDSTAPMRFDRRLVILSPHTERIREEIGRAFARYWKARTGETVYLDWRVPGGTSEIALFLRSEFSSAFRYRWEQQLGRPWTQGVATSFADPTATGAANSGRSSPGAGQARTEFLSSDTGIGVDLLFGGGSYDFQQHAEAGFLVARSHDGRYGPAVVMSRHPDWFTDHVIPAAVSGEPFRDPEGRWIGVVLASFGIVYNRDVLRRLGVGHDPEHWRDLGEPGLAGQVALADPTKSGSVAKAFELIIQQQMHEAHSGLRSGIQQSTNREPRSMQAVRDGWAAGLRLIQRISANARYFTDSASKIPLEVARGDAAAGMAIDAYGWSTAEYVRRPDGYSRVGFVAPSGGTSISVDAIAMVRGAPDPELATAFVEFILSEEGQAIWAFRRGAPGGPVNNALRRLPVRKDFYTDLNRRYMADPTEQPYDTAASFVYHPEWTGPVFGAIRLVIRAMCVDTHQEQTTAWRAMRDHGFPEAATAVFHDLSGVAYEDALRFTRATLQSKDKVRQVQLARELADAFRLRYLRAAKLAIEGSRWDE